MSRCSVILFVFQNKAKQAIDSLCTKLPNSMKTECSDFVRGRGDSIVKELTQVIDPQEVNIFIIYYTIFTVVKTEIVSRIIIAGVSDIAPVPFYKVSDKSSNCFDKIYVRKKK